MTRAQQILQFLAAADREVYGLDLVTGGAASRASLYVELFRLEEHGLIESRFEDGAEYPRRRLYRITAAGNAALVPTLPIAKIKAP